VICGWAQQTTRTERHALGDLAHQQIKTGCWKRGYTPGRSCRWRSLSRELEVSNNPSWSAAPAVRGRTGNNHSQVGCRVAAY